MSQYLDKFTLLTMKAQQSIFFIKQRYSILERTFVHFSKFKNDFEKR